MWLELSLQGLPAYEEVDLIKIFRKCSHPSRVHIKSKSTKYNALFNGNTSIERLTSLISYWIPMKVFSFHKLYIATSYDAHLMATILG